jgi:sensor histidine kinase regulating citrate/malate metabolism
MWYNLLDIIVLSQLIILFSFLFLLLVLLLVELVILNQCTQTIRNYSFDYKMSAIFFTLFAEFYFTYF